MMNNVRKLVLKKNAELCTELLETVLDEDYRQRYAELKVAKARVKELEEELKERNEEVKEFLKEKNLFVIEHSGYLKVTWATPKTYWDFKKKNEVIDFLKDVNPGLLVEKTGYERLTITFQAPSLLPKIDQLMLPQGSDE